MSWSEVVVNRRRTLEAWAKLLELPLEPVEGFESIPWVFRITPTQDFSAWRVCYLLPHHTWPNAVIVRAWLFLPGAFHDLSQEGKNRVLLDLYLRVSMSFPLVEPTYDPPSKEATETDKGSLTVLTSMRVGEDVQTCYDFMKWLTTFQRALTVGQLVLAELEL